MKFMELTPIEIVQYNIGSMTIRFSIIENLLEEFITETYSDDLDLQEAFYKDLMSEKFFSFELKNRIFNKALKRREIEEKFPSNNLNELQALRNIFAHRAPVAESEEDLNDIDKIYFAKTDETFVKLYEKFEYHESIILKALRALPGLNLEELNEKHFHEGRLKKRL